MTASFLPRGLVAWRSALPTKRAVVVRNDGAILQEHRRFELFEARFPSLAAASDAIASGCAPWTKVR